MQKAKREFINPVFRDKVTVLESVAESGGRYIACEMELAPKGGNIMHTHSAFEETFTAVKGVLCIVLSGKKHYLNPGDSITVPLHTPHCFKNESDENITCHIKFTPGHDGFVKGLAIVYGLATDGLTNSKGIPKKISHLAMLISLMDTKPVGLMGVAFPVFKWLAAKAKKNGLEEQLLQKYYYENEN